MFRCSQAGFVCHRKLDLFLRSQQSVPADFVEIHPHRIRDPDVFDDIKAVIGVGIIFGKLDPAGTEKIDGPLEGVGRGLGIL